MTSFFHGVGAFARGFGLIGRPVLRRHAFAPIAITALLFAVLLWFLATRYLQLVDSLVGRAGAGTGAGLLHGLAWLGFALLALAVALLVFAASVSLVSSPFNGLLAAATERALTGVEPAGEPFALMLRKLPWTLWQEAKKVLYGLLLAVPFLLLFLVPVLNVVAPLLWLAYTAWMAAFAFTDYTLANHGLSLADTRRLLRRHRTLVLGFGTAASVALAVPILNLLALPAAVCGGAVLWVEHLRPAPPPPP